ncbi:MAG: alkaline phosphatase [Bacteroidota bacterium]|nr:alkaline phosphatase [Bacteroidota bacterium]
MKTKILYFLIALLIIGFTDSCKTVEQNVVIEDKKAKYVFVFIGDGMGEAHIHLTEAYLAAINGRTDLEHLIMSDFPIIGIQTTFANDKFITGSAASGTALATGHKTNYGTISMAPNYVDTLFSIAYFAHNAGMKVGIISTAGINHATPATFYAHQNKRNQYYEIALQLHKSNFDVFGGGGFISPNGRQKKPLKNAYDITEENGYKVIRDNEDFNKLKYGDNKVLMVSPEISDYGDIPYSIDQTDDMLNLGDYTKKAIQLLDNPDGFFIMVEGGKIDWAAHANDGATVIQEVIDFDNALLEAVKFYERHPNETIIIVTADHETGGLALGNENMHYEVNFSILKNQKGSVDAFNNLIVDFIKQNTINDFTFKKALEMGEDFFGIDIKTLTKEEIRKLKKAHSEFIKTNKDKDLTYGRAGIVATTWLSILNSRAGVGWTTSAHTGNPVPLRALGFKQEIFGGFYDNTDVPKRLAEIMKLKMTH